MSTIKVVIKDGPQFERELREWLIAVKSSDRNKKAVFFVTQLSHLIIANKSGGRINFNSFPNPEFMRGIHEIFREALKCPQGARLDWGEIEDFLKSNPVGVSSKKRRARDQGESSEAEDEGRPKRARAATRKETTESSNVPTKGGGTSSRKCRPTSSNRPQKPSSGCEDATDDESSDDTVNLEVSATQIMCYDPPCKTCISNSLPCLVPIDPNSLACRMCRMKKTKCSKLEEIRNKEPTSKEGDAESDSELTQSVGNSTSLSRKEFTQHKKYEAEQISKLRSQVESLERQNKNLVDSVESLAETILQSLSAQKDIQGAMDNVKGLKAKLRRGGR